MSNSSDLPLLSAVIPTYNRAGLIGTSLTSVINQSYKNLEIIVVDDGSTDNTEEIVKAIDDPRIIYIRSPSNQGGSTARNIGIDSAKGEYIAFLDSDDIWMPQKIEKQIHSILQYPNPENVVGYNQIKLQNSSGIYIFPEKAKSQTEAVADYIFCNGGEMISSTLIMHRSLALSIKFRPNLKKHQDWDLCLRLDHHGAIFEFIKEPLTIWNNQPRDDRISRIIDNQTSINWIREYKSSISPRATVGFMFKEVFPKLLHQKENKVYAQKIIIDALVYQIISFDKFKRYTKLLWNLNHLDRKILRKLRLL